jgi:hypothetical protein
MIPTTRCFFIDGGIDLVKQRLAIRSFLERVREPEWCRGFSRCIALKTDQPLNDSVWGLASETRFFLSHSGSTYPLWLREWRCRLLVPIGCGSGKHKQLKHLIPPHFFRSLQS